MRIMIIDDFEADRKEIRSIIEGWNNRKIKVCGEFRSGQEALQEIRQLRPDICLCDIEMPGMNGFQFAKALRMEQIKTKIIFCSMYSEFQYAKEAMYLDSYGYVLKPVDGEELKRCVEWAAGSIQYQNRMEQELGYLKKTLEENRPVLLENFWKELLYGIYKEQTQIKAKADFFGILFEEQSFGLILVEIDDYEQITESLGIEKKQMLSLRVGKQLKKLVAEKKCYEIQLDDSHYGLICMKGETDILYREMKGTGMEIVDFFSHTDISVSCAIGGTAGHVGELSALYEQCRYIIKYKFVLGKSRVLTREDVPDSREPHLINYNELKQNIKYLLNINDKEQIDLFVSGLLQPVLQTQEREYLKNLCYFLMMCVQSEVNLQNCSMAEIFGTEQAIWEKLSKFETIHDITFWIKNIMWFTSQYLCEKASSRDAVTVRRVKEYIHQHLQESLTLDMIAEQMYYTGNYLNYVFKRETGSTISDYITSQRVERAKEMLKDPKLKLYEIAEALSYSHTAYFSSIFRKYAGMNPKQWRERFGVPGKVDKREED